MGILHSYILYIEDNNINYSRIIYLSSDRDSLEDDILKLRLDIPEYSNELISMANACSIDKKIFDSFGRVISNFSSKKIVLELINVKKAIQTCNKTGDKYVVAREKLRIWVDSSNSYKIGELSENA